MINFNSNTNNDAEWYTPRYILEALGEFDLDPCFLADGERPYDTAKKHYWKEIDGLSQRWEGRVWLNPPYGREIGKWLSKLAEHGNGIALVFARTDTKTFQEQVFGKANAILFLGERLYFARGKTLDTKNPANAASCLIAYGSNNVKILELCKLKGKLIYL